MADLPTNPDQHVDTETAIGTARDTEDSTDHRTIMTPLEPEVQEVATAKACETVGSE